MKIKYLDKVNYGYMVADRYIISDTDEEILIVDFDKVYQIVRRSYEGIDESYLLSMVDYVCGEDCFKIKTLEFSKNNNTPYYLSFKMDYMGDIYNIKINVPSIYKGKIDLKGYNLFDCSYFKLVDIVDNMIDCFDIKGEINNKKLKRELMKYDN